MPRTNATGGVKVAWLASGAESAAPRTVWRRGESRSQGPPVEGPTTDLAEPSSVMLAKGLPIPVADAAADAADDAAAARLADHVGHEVQ